MIKASGMGVSVSCVTVVINLEKHNLKNIHGWS